MIATVVSNRKPAQSRAMAMVAVLCGMAAVGCHAESTYPTGIRQTDAPSSTAVLGPYGVEHIVASIGRAGLPVPHPRDVTGQQCPHIGCVHRVDTDTVSLMEFASPGRAQLYAAPPNIASKSPTW